MNHGQKRILPGDPISNRMACGKAGEVTTFIYADLDEGTTGIGFRIREDNEDEFVARYGDLISSADARTLCRAKRLLDIVPAITGDTLRNCFLAARGSKGALTALKEDADCNWSVEFNGHAAGAGSDFDWLADQVVQGQPSKARLREVEYLIYDRDRMIPEILKAAEHEPWYGNNLA